jgi:hypothetical protein
MLAALRRLEDKVGAVALEEALRKVASGTKGKVGEYPAYETVLNRFGSWARVLELLDLESSRPITPPGPLVWSDKEIIAALRELERVSRRRLNAEEYQMRLAQMPDLASRLPAHDTVMSRLGPWDRLRELLDGPVGRLPDGTSIHGELGLLAYDEINDRVQCHACGEWHRSLSGHVGRKHSITARE